MRLFFVILLSICSIYTYAVGGVDVGNGRLVEVDIEKVFKGEQKVLDYISKIKPIEHKIKDLSAQMKKYHCGDAKIKEVKIVKKLPLDGTSFLKNNYSGTAYYQLINCQNKINIKDKK